MDLIFQSRKLKARPSDVFERFFDTGWSPDGETPWVGYFTLELRKPCGFLEGNWCRIYPTRPIGRAQFPEAWFIWPRANQLHPRRNRFDHYPCLRIAPAISGERRMHLVTLSQMATQERWLSDFYLFGCSPFYIDMRNVVDELVEVAENRSGRRERFDPEVPHVIPYALVEEVFQGRLGRAGVTAQILQKVADLDRPEMRISFLELKKYTDKLERSLASDHVVIYHRFDGDTLRSYEAVRKKRSHLKIKGGTTQGRSDGRQRTEKSA